MTQRMLSKSGLLRILILQLLGLGLCTSQAVAVDSLWTRSFDFVTRQDTGLYVAVDRLGNTYVTGSADSSAHPTIVTMKYSPDGVLEWVRTFDSQPDADDWPAGIEAVDGGYVYVAGTTNPGGSAQHIVLLKYNAEGDEVWAREYDLSPSSTVATALRIDDAGIVYVVGWVSVGAGVEFITAKIESDGDTLWTRISDVDQGSHVATAVDVGPSGNVYVTGWSDDGGGANEDFLTISYNSMGQLQWIRRFDGPGSDPDIPAAIGVSGDGSIYVTGQADWGGGLDDNYLTIKYDASGDTVWTRTYDGSNGGADGATALCILEDGSVVVTGFSRSLDGSDDCSTIRYFPSGDTAWTRRFNTPVDDRASAIVSDRAGNSVIAGVTATSNDIRDALAIKYDSSGNELWVYSFAGVSGRGDEFLDIDIDAGGIVSVVGMTDSDDPNNEDVLVSRIAECGPLLRVTTLADDGTGSLRGALIHARDCAGAETIEFDLAGTIYLESELPVLSDLAGGVLMNGYSAPGSTLGNPTVTIDGSSLSSGPAIEVSSSNNSVIGLHFQNVPGAAIAAIGLGRRNTVALNLFSNNDGLAIDLGNPGVTINDPSDADTGPNDLLNYPIIDSIQEHGKDTFTVFGTVAPKAEVEIYLAERFGDSTTQEHATNHGPAYALLGSAVADANGLFKVDSIIECVWSLVTAIAIDTLGNTSEFCRNHVLSADPLRITAYSNSTSKMPFSQLEIVVVGPLDSLGLRDSIGPTFNTYETGRATYSTATDFGASIDPDTRVRIGSPDPGLYKITYRLPDPGGTPGDYLTGIGINAHQEYTNVVSFAASGDIDTTSHHHNPLVPGDPDGDGSTTIIDVVLVVNCVFRGDECLRADDLNCDGVHDVLDVVRAVGVAFRGDPPPPPCAY